MSEKSKICSIHKTVLMNLPVDTKSQEVSANVRVDCVQLENFFFTLSQKLLV